MDPRLTIIDDRLKEIEKVIAVSGGKGGIGKSSVASVFALTLSQMGYTVGLLDMDFCGPSDHVILGMGDLAPEEDKGLIPPEFCGMKFMSIIYYAGDKPSPLRGDDVSNALIELLAVTLWGNLDFLIIDMPPGIGDAVLDVIRLIEKTVFLVVTTESRIALETVKKFVTILKELNIPLMGIVENMKMQNSSNVKKAAESLNTSFLGEIPYDPSFEKSLGDVDRLLNTVFAKNVKKIIETAEKRKK
jgi:ATP-binding protein involved in chromosome partitioning